MPKIQTIELVVDEDEILLERHQSGNSKYIYKKPTKFESLAPESWIKNLKMTSCTPAVTVTQV